MVVLRCVEVGWHLIALGYNNIKELFFQALMKNRQKLCQMFPQFNIRGIHLHCWVMKRPAAGSVRYLFKVSGDYFTAKPASISVHLIFQNLIIEAFDEKSSTPGTERIL